MTQAAPDPDDLGLQQEESVSDPDSYGGLSVEDDPDGTTDPGELAGSAGDDDRAGYAPEYSEADSEAGSESTAGDSDPDLGS